LVVFHVIKAFLSQKTKKVEEEEEEEEEVRSKFHSHV
jgi:hypothetical protein